MRTTTLVTGVLLFLLGPIFFALGGANKSFTAFIPSIFGIVLIICGALSKTVKSTKMAMHIAVVVAFLGMVGSLFGKKGLSIPGWIAALTGKSDSPLASYSQMLLFLLCGFFVVRSVLWFLGNRSARSAA